MLSPSRPSRGMPLVETDRRRAAASTYVAGAPSLRGAGGLRNGARPLPGWRQGRDLTPALTSIGSHTPVHSALLPSMPPRPRPPPVPASPGERDAAPEEAAARRTAGLARHATRFGPARPSSARPRALPGRHHNARWPRCVRPTTRPVARRRRRRPPIVVLLPNGGAGDAVERRTPSPPTPARSAAAATGHGRRFLWGVIGSTTAFILFRPKLVQVR